MSTSKRMKVAHNYIHQCTTNELSLPEIYSIGEFRLKCMRAVCYRIEYGIFNKHTLLIMFSSVMFTLIDMSLL